MGPIALASACHSSNEPPKPGTEDIDQTRAETVPIWPANRGQDQAVFVKASSKELYEF